MRLALVGNPNCGKTTLFNALTGSSAHVGNWPGVTVTCREGEYRGLPVPVKVVDLPGVYSLSPYTPEEIATCDFLTKSEPDVIVNIVDATNLERNLYLTTQLLELDRPIVIALNMMDLIQKNGTEIDISLLQERLGVPVVPISALKDQDIHLLMKKAYEVAQITRSGFSILSDSNISVAFEKVVAICKQQSITDPLFHATKLLENDQTKHPTLTSISNEVSQIKQQVLKQSDVLDDCEAIIADARYQYITQNFHAVVHRLKNVDQFTYSDKIDRVLLNRFFGLPIFLLLIFSVFHITFSQNFLFLEQFGFEAIPSPGALLHTGFEGLMEGMLEYVAGWLAGTAEWVQGLIVDGVLTGITVVLSFLPLILMIFFFLSIMENSGYMARAAFLMDHHLRRFGLSGKAFVPLLMGFGCSVPAIMATRGLESEKERRLTIMLMPFFSCGAKMPIWAILAVSIFPNTADFVMFMIYLLGISVAVIAAIILKKFVFRGEVSTFVMELPAYRLPQWKKLISHLWEKIKGFVIQVTTIVAGATVVIWFLSNFSLSLQMVDAGSADSILGVLGNIMRPVFLPLGFASGDDGWKAIVAIIAGLAAKELVVSTMGVLYNPDVAGDALEDDSANLALVTTIAAAFSPLAAVSFMAFNLLTIPCMAAIATAHAEMRSWRWTQLTLAFWFATAWLVAFLIYQVGSLLGIGV